MQQLQQAKSAKPKALPNYTVKAPHIISQTAKPLAKTRPVYGSNILHKIPFPKTDRFLFPKLFANHGA